MPINTEQLSDQIQNLICNTIFEMKQSVNQDFLNNYSRLIWINTEFKLQCTNQYSVEDLNQFYQDYQKLIQSFN